MLDLEALIADMHGLAGEVARTAEEAVRRRERALAQLETARVLPDLREAVRRFAEDMALPVAGTDMGRTYPAPPAGDYTVLATDGSQIPPDYHNVASWYVINAGCALFRYGAPPGRERCRLLSRPRLLPPRTAPRAGENDPAADALSAAAAVRGPQEAERLIAELEYAAQVLDEEHDPGRTALLLDGPLVQWRMINVLQPREAQEAVVRAFRQLLSKCRETGTPVAGYISRSRAVAWVTLIRFTLCPEVAAEGRLCPACRETLLKNYTEPPAEAHHADLAGVRDVELAALLLPLPGMRTEVLELQSGVWKQLTGEEGHAGFFYLNTGTEVARLEIPEWVWEDAGLMELLHAAAWDQCEAGGGYPMVLAEAHEQAVVRAADRQTFYAVIERILEERGVSGVMTSAKAASKRRPLA